MLGPLNCRLVALLFLTISWVCKLFHALVQLNLGPFSGVVLEAYLWLILTLEGLFLTISVPVFSGQLADLQLSLLL